MTLNFNVDNQYAADFVCGGICQHYFDSVEVFFETHICSLH